MQYRKFGKLDLQVSALGFGCMRFPLKANEDGTKSVDVDQAIKMLHHAIDNGMNYIDTAYIYHQGQSETLLGKALQGGYREKVKIATKLPTWNVNEPDDFEKILDEQLENLQTDCIDFYLFHALNKVTWEEKVLKFDLLKKAEIAKEKGKIKHLGFSFHDEYDVFTTIIDSYDKWELCQIQYNYFNVNDQAGIKGLKYAAGKGLAIVIMEPLLGGRLSLPPGPVEEIFKQADEHRTATDWALQWLWSQPEISVVLSGMSNMQQIDENLQSADRSGINKMGESELQTIEQVYKRFKELNLISCTGCRYCIPCPAGVNIPENFKMINDGYSFNKLQEFRTGYTELMENDLKSAAVSCVGCKACETKCPQHIKISEWMPRIHTIWKKAGSIKMSFVNNNM